MSEFKAGMKEAHGWIGTRCVEKSGVVVVVEEGKRETRADSSSASEESYYELRRDFEREVLRFQVSSSKVFERQRCPLRLINPHNIPSLFLLKPSNYPKYPARQVDSDLGCCVDGRVFRKPVELFGSRTFEFVGRVTALKSTNRCDAR